MPLNDQVSADIAAAMKARDASRLSALRMLKAAVMNLLSTGAAYGVIVATFQWGWLGHGLTNGRTGPIDPACSVSSRGRTCVTGLASVMP